MSKSSPETNPKILLNGKQQEKHQEAAGGEQTSVLLDDECLEDSRAAERETQAKVQSVFQQVRNQIRSQAGVKSSILELVQRVKDRETESAQVDVKPEGTDVNGGEKKEMLTEDSKDEMHAKEEELFAMFKEKLEASQKDLKDEFEVQISQVRKEMQAYMDQALKGLESQMQSSWQSHNLQHDKEKQESKGPDKKQKPTAAPTLASRRGRVLTRTMTTIIPKTCPPVIICPRAKSETLGYSKRESSRLVLRDPGVSLPGNNPCQSRKPLPPVCPLLHQHKKPVRPKDKTGN
ncbi:hypothetical protein CesoFtcFv8_003835 [Champsocephalus esox]|uniref:Uncharacterized protein n=1 Tax=Champsocephalus esox TaxID=159716 RepID=A0AAN8HBX8_9TELE|nr:hypothetical protein CesoFtcFv8_003835 [Champsocephalus esox]